MTTDAIARVADEQADEGPFGPFLSEQEREEYHAFLAGLDGRPENEEQPGWVEEMADGRPW